MAWKMVLGWLVDDGGGDEGLNEEERVVWWCVMIVEYRNAFFNKLARDPFCTACPGLGTCPGLGLSRIPCILFS